MDLATGAMGSLLPKLLELLKEEYDLQKGVREGVKSLEKEMQSMHAALHKVAKVPHDQLDEQVMLWAGEVRELSFDMEDVIDKFLVHVEDESEPTTKSNKLKRLMEKMSGLFSKGKARHEIADAIKEINKQVKEVAKRRGRYTIDNIVVRPTAVMTVDPRLKALYDDVTELVGIAGKRDQELMRLLSDEDSLSKNKLKIVSVVGFGGLGKTTLVKKVYDKIKEEFDCKVFVPVGRGASAKKVFTDIILDLDKYKGHFAVLDERQLIDKLREILEKKRYLIVIDDIWDEKLWEDINMAFSRINNVSSRIITTTRKISVAKLCCSATNDSVYQMEPLSSDDSRRLFYKRIFSEESGCPDEFKEVSKNILKKCGGVPLAIITIASLLASDHQVKHVDEWHVLLDSIGRGLQEDRNVEDMLIILSYSYYDLPSHLKTCLLYLSMFPEDYLIGKDRLIWMWIAENFVQSENSKRTSLFEIGETYYNDLVNRNMIMPVYDDYIVEKASACRVHDMVLDLLYLLSSKDNFVTVLNGTEDTVSSERCIRRLSLQNARNGELQTTPLESVSMFPVRSVAAFKPGTDLMPSLSSFVVLRVLDLTGCDLRDHNHLNLGDLGTLLHLRYLGLAKSRISKVPEDVGKLQFLQVLDLSGNDSMELPSAIIKLRRLMCLLIDVNHETLPDGLGNLTSMEVLGEICCDSLSILHELGNMARLRDIKIVFKYMSLGFEEAFVGSLVRLSNIQNLEIDCRDIDSRQVLDILGEHWEPPRSLRGFSIYGFGRTSFSTVPAWIKRNPSHHPQLSVLFITLKQFRQEDLVFFGRLPALQKLGLTIHSGQPLVVADGFCCLKSFWLDSKRTSQIMFQPGAMPKAEIVNLSIGVRVTQEDAPRNGADSFGIAMENLSSLRKAYVTLYAYRVTIGEAIQAKAAVVEALRAHPNRPTSHVDITW